MNKLQRNKIRRKKGLKRFEAYHERYANPELTPVPYQQKDMLVGLYGTTGKICSCADCGNPRKKAWGTRKDHITRQERLAELKLKEEFQEIFEGV